MMQKFRIFFIFKLVEDQWPLKG